jgi:DDE family transposase
VDTDVSLDEDWGLLLGLLPEDLTEIALRTRAIIRFREIRSASDLVRLALVYAQDDSSLRYASAWAKESGVATLSDTAVMNRLRGSCGMLRELVMRLLGPADRLVEGPRVVLVDSTTVCRRRSAGTDFRVHVNYAAAKGQISGVELTRAEGGERLDRLPCGLGDLLIADQGYTSRSCLAEVVRRGADFAVRMYPTALPLEYEDGRRADPLELCRDLHIGEILDVPLQTVATRAAPSIRGRLVALRKTQEQTLRQIERTRTNSGKEPGEQAKSAARYIFIFTNLSPSHASTRAVLDLYRLRWQIEMAFKRAKGVVSLGETLARDMELCECKILAKLLLILLIQAFETAFFPWGYPLPRFQPMAKA